MFLALPLAAAAPPGAGYAHYLSAKRKLEQVERGSLKAGSRVALTPAELSSYAHFEARRAYPDGVRNTVVKLGADVATGSAIVDFGKIRRAQGQAPGWFMGKLLDGERPVSVTARIRSGGGKAVVDVQSVEISGIAIEGAVLDFLIRNYLLANYPEAKIGEPFELGHRIERVEVRPAAVSLLIGS
jgi:hypothetical protein